MLETGKTTPDNFVGEEGPAVGTVSPEAALDAAATEALPPPPKPGKVAKPKRGTIAIPAVEKPAPAPTAPPGAKPFAVVAAPPTALETAPERSPLWEWPADFVGEFIPWTRERVAQSLGPVFFAIGEKRGQPEAWDLPESSMNKFFDRFAAMANKWKLRAPFFDELATLWTLVALVKLAVKREYEAKLSQPLSAK